MICLPAISNREGCALLQPAPSPTPSNSDESNTDGGKNIDVKSLLNALGGCVECANDDIMNTMMVTTAMMGPMYGVMRNNRDWLGEIWYLQYSSIVDRIRLILSYSSQKFHSETRCISPRR